MTQYTQEDFIKEAVNKVSENVNAFEHTFGEAPSAWQTELAANVLETAPYDMVAEEA